MSESAREVNIRTVEAYLNALRVKDLSLAPLHPEVVFEEPLTGRNTGADALRAFLSGFLPAIEGVRVNEHICEGDTVVTNWEVDAVFGTVKILERFRIAGGQIVESSAFYDPRVIIG